MLWRPFVSQPLDLVILALFAFLVLGPKRFPELARSAGHWLREMRTAFFSPASPEKPDQQSEDGESGFWKSSAVGAADPKTNPLPPRSRHRDLDAIG
jgi:Sec-independent protein translocase protein TatA